MLTRWILLMILSSQVYATSFSPNFQCPDSALVLITNIVEDEQISTKSVVTFESPFTSLSTEQIERYEGVIAQQGEQIKLLSTELQVSKYKLASLENLSSRSPTRYFKC